MHVHSYHINACSLLAYFALIQSISDRYKSRAVANKDLCARCFVSTHSTEEDYFSIENILSEMAFHEYFECK